MLPSWRSTKMEQSIINKFGGRKFLLTLGCGLVTSFLAYTHSIDSVAYSMVILGTVGSYIGGNVMQKKHKGENETTTE